jgi:hypothetical protein
MLEAVLARASIAAAQGQTHAQGLERWGGGGCLARGCLGRLCTGRAACSDAKLQTCQIACGLQSSIGGREQFCVSPKLEFRRPEADERARLLAQG